MDALSDFDSGAPPKIGPAIAAGDITGDGQIEILFNLQAGDGEEAHEDGVFWRHPVTLTWNGTAFEELDAAWTGIPSPSPTLTRVDRQGLPRSLVIADLDRDGVKEIAIGTGSYRNPNEYGAIYVFEWNGTGFEAEYANFCIGSVIRMDVLGNGGVTLSALGYESTGFVLDDGVCPELMQNPDTLFGQLFLLLSDGPDEYHVRPVVSGQDEDSSFAVNPQDPLITQFIWFKYDKGRFWQDWRTATSYKLDGHRVDNIIPPQTEYLGSSSIAADLDGDGVDEIVSKVGDYPDGSTRGYGFAWGWQVFGMTDGEYRVVSEVNDYQLGAVSFVAGDIGNDGKEDIVDGKGRVYTWNGSRLCYRGNVIEAAGLELQYGFQSIFVGDVYGDRQNRLVGLARPGKEQGREDTPEYRPLGMYVVRVDLAESEGVCLEE